MVERKSIEIVSVKGEMQYNVVITEGEDGWYVVECPAIPGCVSQGKTVEEALENIKEAIQGCLEVLNERVCLKSRGKVWKVMSNGKASYTLGQRSGKSFQ